MVEISLYFHIPFCKKKCPYCHFFVLPYQKKSHDELLEALELEWELVLPKIGGHQIVSVYFGGGTPTLIGAESIAAILSLLPPLEPDCEISLEANPEEISLSLMQEMKEAGINRVSIGVQSLDDPSLIILGRNHSSWKAQRAVEQTYLAGIENISIDLMYDLPAQTLESWNSTLKQIGTLPISHLSLYNLTLEPHTAFFKKKEQLTPLLPQQETSLEMLTCAISHLEFLGLSRYEISAFAKKGKESRHNLGYWTARPFWGFGPSAFSYWDKKRSRNIAHLGRYRTFLNEGRSPIDFSEELPYPDNLHELLAVELRLLQGVNLDEFAKRHGPLADETRARLAQIEEKGWLEKVGERIRLTEKGLLFYDSVATEII